MVDDEVLDRFRLTAERSGKGYQTLINDALRAHQWVTENRLTAKQVREILREELASNTES
jgi:BrnA antitoxin of type II toxin-antitoxin system